MKMILNEASRDKLLMPYLDLFIQRGQNVSLSLLKQALLRKFVNEALIRNLSLSSNYYLAGVARYYFQGQLTTNKELGIFNDTQDNFIPELCERLNALIMVLRNSYIDSVGTKFEQPEDFGELPLNKLLRKYGKLIDAELGIVRTPKNNGEEKPEPEVINTNVGKGYTFDILYEYQQARKYNKDTEPGAWCITYGEQHYNAYIRMLKIHYVILLKNGYENVERKKGPNFPRDNYGNSMIALLQSNENGEPVYITSRWNHGSSDCGSCEADHAYTKEELFKVTGMNDSDLQRIFQIWQKNKVNYKKEGKKKSPIQKENELRILREAKTIQMKINGGANPEELFSYIKVLYGAKNFRNEATASVFKVELKDEDGVGTIIKMFMIFTDKGKLYFNTIAPYELYKFRRFASTKESNNTSERLVRYVDNLILIQNPKNELYSLYNTRMHSFLTVDGETKFKYIPDPWITKENDNIEYFELAQTAHKRCLINAKTLTPVKIPGRECWYESVGNYKKSWTNDNTSMDYFNDSKINKCNFTIMTYDSSSGEAYLFNLKTGSFIDLDKIGIKWYELRQISKFDNSDYYNLETYSNEIHEYRIIDINGIPQSINGIDKFSYADVFRNLVIYSLNGQQSFRLYNANEGKDVELNGCNEFLTIHKNRECDFAVLALLNQKDQSSEKWYLKYDSLIYDANQNSFKINPFTGNNIFKTGRFCGIYLIELRVTPEIFKMKKELIKNLFSANESNGSLRFNLINFDDLPIDDQGCVKINIPFDVRTKNGVYPEKIENINANKKEEIPMFESLKLNRNSIMEMVIKCLNNIL